MESLQTITETPKLVFREMPKTPDPDEMRKGLVEERKKTGTGVLTTTPKVQIPPLSLYQEIRKRPYSADYFDLGVEWEHWNFPKELSTIENFIKEEIKLQGLTDTVESYQEVITGLEDRIGRRFNERIWHRLDRLTSYINAVKNFRKWQALKSKLEGTSNGEGS